MNINDHGPRTGRECGELGTIINVADLQNAQLGGFGGDYIGDTAAHTPGTGYVFVALQVLADSVLSAYAPAFDGNTFTGVTLTAGTIILGRFTSVTLTSGKVLAYKGV